MNFDNISLEDTFFEKSQGGGIRLTPLIEVMYHDGTSLYTTKDDFDGV